MESVLRHFTMKLPNIIQETNLTHNLLKACSNVFNKRLESSFRELLSRILFYRQLLIKSDIYLLNLNKNTFRNLQLEA